MIDLGTWNFVCALRYQLAQDPFSGFIVYDWNWLNHLRIWTVWEFVDFFSFVQLKMCPWLIWCFSLEVLPFENLYWILTVPFENFIPFENFEPFEDFQFGIIWLGYCSYGHPNGYIHPLGQSHPLEPVNHLRILNRFSIKIYGLSIYAISGLIFMRFVVWPHELAICYESDFCVSRAKPGILLVLTYGRNSTCILIVHVCPSVCLSVCPTVCPLKRYLKNQLTFGAAIWCAH